MLPLLQACSCGQAGAKDCEPRWRPTNSPRDWARLTPVSLSWLVLPQSKQCRLTGALHVSPSGGHSVDFKPFSSLFPFPLPPCSSLSSDHPGTRLSIILVSCCSPKHESLHVRGYACQALGLVRPISPRPCFPIATFHSIGNEVTHESTWVTGEKILVPRRGRVSEESGRGRTPTHTNHPRNHLPLWGDS